jgi:hypothetical protein
MEAAFGSGSMTGDGPPFLLRATEMAVVCEKRARPPRPNSAQGVHYDRSHCSATVRSGSRLRRMPSSARRGRLTAPWRKPSATGGYTVSAHRPCSVESASIRASGALDRFSLHVPPSGRATVEPQPPGAQQDATKPHTRNVRRSVAMHLNSERSLGIAVRVGDQACEASGGLP